MHESVFALPVCVEQIAAAIRQMTVRDRERLLGLVPDLREKPIRESSVSTLEHSQTSVGKLRSEVQDALNHQVLAPDAPFLGELTLAQYHALSHDGKAELWGKKGEKGVKSALDSCSDQ